MAISHASKLAKIVGSVKQLVPTSVIEQVGFGP